MRDYRYDRVPSVIPAGQELTRVERVIQAISPSWALQRVRARVLASTFVRHFEAAQPGRRTSGWRRSASDANSANGIAIHALRNHARDLVRNNGWAKRAKQIVANNTIGWGIVPKPIAGKRAARRAAELWAQWGETPQCDINGQLDFYGLQRQAAATIAEAGEVLIRRYPQPASSGMTIPLKLQVLEADHIDTTRDGTRTPEGNRLIQGKEYDDAGKCVAFWLFPFHPGSNFVFGSKIAPSWKPSERVPAEDVAHGYYVDRPGQVRGVSWFAPAIVKLKDYDEFEDATLMRQKIAACFAAFVTDIDGGGPAVGQQSQTDPLVQSIEPGTVTALPMGKNIEFAEPPAAGDGGFDTRTLRAIAAAIGVTYEEMTGDYSGVNFSSARMARIAHWANVHDWRYNMMIPMLCAPAWNWAMQMAVIAGSISASDVPRARWTPPPMPMIEPDKEGLAIMRMVRIGAKTISEMIREQGGDPETHFEEFAADLARLDELKIILDCDPRKTSQAGNQPTTTKPAKAM